MMELLVFTFSIVVATVVIFIAFAFLDKEEE